MRSACTSLSHTTAEKGKEGRRPGLPAAACSETYIWPRPKPWVSWIPGCQNGKCRAGNGYLPPSPGGCENLGRLNTVSKVKILTVLGKLPKFALKALL